ncbi:MAG TPA: argininosuccinate lyase [bacterium]
MWGGRFSKPLASDVLAFTASFSIDRRLLRWDVIASIAHALALQDAAVIGVDDAETITGGLAAILRDVEAGRLEVGGPHEDVHSFLEATLFERIGAAAGRLHAGRSRNDQVATAFRLWVKEHTLSLVEETRALLSSLAARAAESLDIILPGFTHLQHAQPVRLAHHLLAYAWMLLRDVGRLRAAYDAADVLPLGSGAIAGAGFPLDRGRTASRLGFARISENSIDAVGDRDFAVEAVFAAALLATHLSRWAGELVLWATDEFGFVRLADRIATGSSLMPQKKNPDAAELIRAKAARAAGQVTAILGLLKGLPSGYNLDLQEDKAAVFDSLDTLHGSLVAMGAFLAGVEFNAERMGEAAGRGYTTATEAADYLVRRGVPFREAHEAAGRLVQLAAGRDVPLWALPVEAYRTAHPAFDEDVLESVGVEAAVESKRLPGGTARGAVVDQMRDLRDALEEVAAWQRRASASLRSAEELLG